MPAVRGTTSAATSIVAVTDPNSATVYRVTIAEPTWQVGDVLMQWGWQNSLSTRGSSGGGVLAMANNSLWGQLAGFNSPQFGTGYMVLGGALNFNGSGLAQPITLVGCVRVLDGLEPNPPVWDLYGPDNIALPNADFDLAAASLTMSDVDAITSMRGGHGPSSSFISQGPLNTLLEQLFTGQLTNQDTTRTVRCPEVQGVSTGTLITVLAWNWDYADGIKVVISALTFVGTTVTITVTVGQGQWAVNQTLLITGVAGVSNVNGEWVITQVVSTTQFRFVVTSTPVGTYTASSGSAQKIATWTLPSGFTTVMSRSIAIPESGGNLGHHYNNLLAYKTWAATGSADFSSTYTARLPQIANGYASQAVISVTTFRAGPPRMRRKSAVIRFQSSTPFFKRQVWQMGGPR